MSPVGAGGAGGVLSAVAQLVPSLSPACPHTKLSALGQDHSSVTDGQGAHQTMNRVHALRMSAKGMVPSTKLQEQLSYRELLFLGEMICYLLLQQTAFVKLVFPWLPYHQQPTQFGHSFCKQKFIYMKSLKN